MTKLTGAAVAAMMLAMPAVAHESHTHRHATFQTTQQVVVACYRGPWEQVYWDRALPAFYDSLRALGYSPATADAIGNRICRDQSLVGNQDALRREAMRIIAATPIR